LLRYSKEDKMETLIVGTQSSPKEDKVKEIIKAAIHARASRKYWYVRYQVLLENNKVEHKEESTKVLKTEKILEYMTDTYLPAWLEDKKEELRKDLGHSTTLAYYASEFLDECKGYADYDNIASRTNRIVAKFGNENISTMKIRPVKKWINALMHEDTGEELSKSYRSKFKRIFNGIFDIAVEEEAIDDNNISNIKVSGRSSNQRKDEVKPFSIEEVNTLLTASKDTKYGELLHLYLGLVFNLGLSPHEAIGLQVGDISWDRTTQKNILHIQRGITKKKLGDTKNEYRNRSIVLRDEVMIYLNLLTKEAKRKRSIWLFSHEDGTRLGDIEELRGTKAYISPTKGYYEHRNSKWYKLLEDCNIEYRPLKNCRHTFAMTALDKGIYTNPQLSNTLGHNSMDMVINHYAKHIKEKALEVDGTVEMYNL